MEDAIQALSSKSSSFRFIDTWTALHEDDHNGFTFPACNPVKRIDYIFAKKNDNICENSNGETESLSCNENKVQILNTFIIGQEPTEDTSKLIPSYDNILNRWFALFCFDWLCYLSFLISEHLVNSREGIGMNDPDSPIWASDHFALVTDLALDWYSHGLLVPSHSVLVYDEGL